ncbi:MAG: hypothetical protein Q8P20_03145 [bacterium]|nr:hypothetical protein [bacterium]
MLIVESLIDKCTEAGPAACPPLVEATGPYFIIYSRYDILFLKISQEK